MTTTHSVPCCCLADPPAFMCIHTPCHPSHTTTNQIPKSNLCHRDHPPLSAAHTVSPAYTRLLLHTQTSAPRTTAVHCCHPTQVPAAACYTCTIWKQPSWIACPTTPTCPYLNFNPSITQQPTIRQQCTHHYSKTDPALILHNQLQHQRPLQTLKC